MFSNNKVVPVVNEKSLVKISYNDEKCFYCHSNDMIVNDLQKKNLSYCKRCEKYVLLFEYVSSDKYKNIIESKKKTSFNNFILSSDI